MYKILDRQVLAEDTYLLEVHAPRIANAALPGQFLIVKKSEHAERIPLTISDYDRQKGSVIIVFKKIGKSTKDIIPNPSKFIFPFFLDYLIENPNLTTIMNLT